jgi:hypothetical protein
VGKESKADLARMIKGDGTAMTPDKAHQTISGDRR